MRTNSKSNSTCINNLITKVQNIQEKTFLYLQNYVFLEKRKLIK